MNKLFKILSSCALLVSVTAQADTLLLNNQDQGIVNKIHSLNQLEIKAGKLTSVRSNTMDVRNYGSMLWRDHQIADQQLMAFANAQRMILSDRLLNADRFELESLNANIDAINSLNRLRGRPFDREFLLAMRDGHLKALEMSSLWLNRAQNRQLKLMIRGMTPTLCNHLQRAQNLLLHLNYDRGFHALPSQCRSM